MTAIVDSKLLAAIRSLMREELERVEARRSGERPKGQRRLRSLALAAKLSEQISGPVDEVTKARVRRAMRRTG